MTHIKATVKLKGCFEHPAEHHCEVAILSDNLELPDRILIADLLVRCGEMISWHRIGGKLDGVPLADLKEIRLTFRPCEEVRHVE